MELPRLPFLTISHSPTKTYCSMEGLLSRTPLELTWPISSSRFRYHSTPYGMRPGVTAIGIFDETLDRTDFTRAIPLVDELCINGPLIIWYKSLFPLCKSTRLQGIEAKAHKHKPSQVPLTSPATGINDRSAGVSVLAKRVRPDDCRSVAANLG
jgi:hypothetical protein